MCFLLCGESKKLHFERRMWKTCLKMLMALVAIGAVVCDLTEADLDAIRSVVSHLETRMVNSLKELEARMDTSQKESEARIITSQKELIAQSKKEILAEVSQGFRTDHNFGRDRYTISNLASGTVSVAECEGISSAFYVAVFGKVVGFMAPHLNCSGLQHSPPTNIISHPKYDLALITGCPRTRKNYILNMSTYADVKIGDKVAITGVAGVIAPCGEGTVVGVYSADLNCSNTPFSGSAQPCPGEFIVHSDQYAGQSGGVVMSGCGIAGMAHLAVTDDNAANFGAFIPSEVMLEFVSNNIHRLTDVTDCAGLTVLPVPVLPFLELSCSLQSQVILSKDCSNGSCVVI